MKTYEVNEWCPNCEAENSLQWNVKEMGYVAKCTECGEKLMLCDECRHEYNEEKDEIILKDYCDWCADGGDGVCYRDTSPVELTTYGRYDEENYSQFELFFVVPKNWLWNYIRETEWKTLNNFLNNYLWDNAEPVYEQAKRDHVVIKEWEV